MEEGVEEQEKAGGVLGVAGGVGRWLVVGVPVRRWECAGPWTFLMARFDATRLGLLSMLTRLWGGIECK